MRAICDCLPDAILSEPGTGPLLKLSRQLPAFAVDTVFGFESRLADPAPACDFFLTAFPHARFGHHLIRLGRRAEATDFAAGLGWYLGEVQRPESFLARWLNYAILEYDLIDATGYPPPGVFLEAHEQAEQAHKLVRTSRKREKQGNPGVLTSALCGAVARTEDPNERRLVESLFNALPARAGCSHIGALPIRKPRAIRVVFSMSPGECITFMNDVNWSGRTDRLKQVEAEIGHLIRRVGVSCDITAAGLSPTLGLELFRDKSWRETPTSEWHDFLDYASSERWCTPDKAKALKTWAKMQMIFAGDDIVWLVSGINHFKLIFAGDFIQAKAYIGARLVSA